MTEGYFFHMKIQSFYSITCVLIRIYNIYLQVNLRVSFVFIQFIL